VCRRLKRCELRHYCHFALRKSRAPFIAPFALDKFGQPRLSPHMDRPLLKDIAACLRFYSRLPIPSGVDGHAMPDFRLAARALPLAGGVIGGCGALGLLAARAFGGPPLPSAVCAVAALVAVCGALHEDGLADVADGFGGGRDRERKLEIMRDSRIGSYGAVVLILSLMLRVSALAAITERGAFLGAAALIAVGAVSRAAGLAPLAMLPPARADGAGAAALRPDPSTLRQAALYAAAVSLLPLLFGASLGEIILADFASIGAAMLVVNLARRQIGGYTGDVLGAAQQAAEIAGLVFLSAHV
jgi:adenosylcobinamide-GDP ribazoletransferase